MTDLDNLMLAEAIDRYAENKSSMDAIKKLCDKDNATIKEIMTEEKMNICSTEDNTAKIIEVDKSYTDEAKLLSVIHAFNIPNSLGIIKTKEYIDEDALESAIYNNEIPDEVMQEIIKCKVEKYEYRLQVKKNKKGA